MNAETRSGSAEESAEESAEGSAEVREAIGPGFLKRNRKLDMLTRRWDAEN